MSSRPLSLRRLATGAAALLAVTLAPVAPAAADHAHPPGPVHAGNTYGWYSAGRPIDYTFVGPLPKYWKRQTPQGGNVRTQHGMITLNSGKRGDVIATLMRPPHKVGRWEIRMRTRRYESRYADYSVRAELVPGAAYKYECGNRNISLHRTRLGTGTADFYVRTRPDNEWLYRKNVRFGPDQWHTFALEVTRKHVAWFVDAHVVSTLRRPEAISGVPLTVRLSLVAQEGKRMNRTRLQLDWLRYWTMKAKNKKSIKAPAGKRRTFGGACPSQ